MKITTITCTGDRPEAFALCEKYLASQTLKPHQMIVLDDGEAPVRCTLGQDYFYRDRWREKDSMILKLRAAFRSGIINGDAVAFIEDDDVYMPEYLASAASRIRNRMMVGEQGAIYYNVAGRWWFNHGNTAHASLCQTVVRREAFEKVVKALDETCPFLDVRLWATIKGSAMFKPDRTPSCVGIKGMPGRKGYGSGHEKKDRNGISDVEMKVLRKLIGDYASNYEKFYRP